MDPIDTADPIEPIESTEPTEPIDSAEPVEAIDRTEPRERQLRTDVPDAGVICPSCRIRRPVLAPHITCTSRWGGGRQSQ